MFNRLFRINASKNKTGIYFVEGNKLTELEESPGNGSINSIIEILGYEIPQIHTIFTFDSKNIECIGVKVFSKEPIFVLAKKKNSQI
ncbi:MAG: hypothetical protein RBS07_12595, partial [Lentimicrobium sp.]|nr:hypothetical protein [Lentimicrobium sp.]